MDVVLIVEYHCCQHCITTGTFIIGLVINYLWNTIENTLNHNEVIYTGTGHAMAWVGLRSVPCQSVWIYGGQTGIGTGNRIFQFYSLSTILSLPHTYSFIYDWRHITIAVDSIIKFKKKKYTVHCNLLLISLRVSHNNDLKLILSVLRSLRCVQVSYHRDS